MLKAHYTALKAHLASTPNPAAPAQSAFVQVAWYNQQYQSAEGSGVPAPCAYIEFQPFDLESLRGGGGHQADLTFRVHICGANHDASDVQALDHLEVVQAVTTHLRGWSAAGLLGSVRVGAVAVDHAQTSLVVSVLTCVARAYFAAPGATVAPPPAVALNIV